MSIYEILLNLSLAFLGVVVALWYENLGSPRLFIENSKTTDDEKEEMGRTRFLHLVIKNVPRHVLFVPRQTASGVHGTITFLDINKNPISGAMPIKWDRRPEPIKYEVSEGEVVRLPDPRLISVSGYIDIYPDEEESLGFALRLLEDDEAYGWTVSSYFYGWRHPAYKLPIGRYFARVKVKSGDKKFTQDILFTNPQEFNGFDLE